MNESVEPAPRAADDGDDASSGGPDRERTDGPSVDARASEVQRAFALGWQLAQLFHEPVHKGEAGSPPLEKQLPGISGLPKAERSVLLARQIGAGIECLLGGQSLCGADVASVLVVLRDPERHPRSVRQVVLSLHVGLLEALTVRDFKLGKSYGLGRALAETVLIPAEDGLEPGARAVAFKDMFEPGRIATIDAWLQQLKCDFPPHASYAVHGSLDRWQKWVNDTQAVAQVRVDDAQKRVGQAEDHKADTDLTKAQSALDGASRQLTAATQRAQREKPGSDPEALSQTLRVGGTLREQGKLWRGMLSGEVIPADLLDVESYLEGGAALMDRLRHMAWRYLRKYTWVVALVLGLAALVIVALWVVPSYTTSNKIATEIAAVAATLGLSVKGVTSTLGRTITEAQAPLWESELDESCAVAATKLPDNIPISRHSSLDVGKIH